MKKLFAIFAVVIGMTAPVKADTALTLYDSTTHYFQMRPPPVMTKSWRLVLPLTTGTTGQSLGIASVAGSTVTMQWATGPTAWGAISGTLSNQTDLQAKLTGIGVSTASLQSQITAQGASTGTLSTRIDNLDASTATITAREVAIGVSTGSLQTQVTATGVSTGTLQASVTSLGASTGTLQTSITALGASTGTIQTSVTNLGASTGTLAASLFATSTATGTLQTQITATGVTTGTLAASLFATSTATGTLATSASLFATSSATGTLQTQITATGVTTGTIASSLFATSTATGTLASLASNNTMTGVQNWTNTSASTITKLTVTNLTTTGIHTSSGVYVTSATVGFDEILTVSTISWTSSNKQFYTLTKNETFTFNAPPHPCNLILRINTGTGSFTATWPATVKWSGGTAPTITVTAAKNDLVACYYAGDGNYYCTWQGNY